MLLSYINLKNYARSFIDCLNDNSLEQLVDVPTRFRNCQNLSLLDLIATSEPDAIQNIITHDPLGICDHCTLYFEIITQNQNQDNSNEKYDYDKLNCKIFMNTMEADTWVRIFSENTSFNDPYDKFVLVVNKVIHAITPVMN